MSSHRDFRPEQQTKLVLEPALGVRDEHAQLVAADARFQTALRQAINAGRERIEAVYATVDVKGRTKRSR